MPKITESSHKNINNLTYCTAKTFPQNSIRKIDAKFLRKFTQVSSRTSTCHLVIQSHYPDILEKHH